MMRKAFTLIEVNLAILVMAGGILSVVVLYSLGYRETRQSREDITSAAYSDSVLSPLVAALSSKTLSWDKFKDLGNYPESGSSEISGWGAYLEKKKDGSIGVVEDPTSLAIKAYNAVMGAIGESSKVTKTGELSASEDLNAIGLVVSHAENSGIVKIGFRASKKAETLLSAPVYYTEVRFQGGFEDNNGGTP